MVRGYKGDLACTSVLRCYYFCSLCDDHHFGVRCMHAYTSALKTAVEPTSHGLLNTSARKGLVYLNENINLSSASCSCNIHCFHFGSSFNHV